MSVQEELLYDKVHKDIEKFGWSAIGVMALADDPDPGPPFVYTIGLYEHDEHPEMIVVGLDPTVAHAMLSGLYMRVAQGERFEDGQIDSEVLEGYDVRFRWMPPEGRPLNVARNYYGKHFLPALQVLWPDSNGVFPDEEGFEERYVGQQDIQENQL